MIASVSVCPWGGENEHEISSFVANHAQGLIYYQPAFRRYLMAVLGAECRSLLAFEDGRLTGVLPVLAKTGPYGTVINSLPFFGSNGGVLAETPQAEDSLRQEYSRLAGEGVVAATWISHPFMEATPPVHDFFDERIAQWTDLSPEKGWGGQKSIDASARRNIQKALSNEITVRETATALDFLESVHRENMAAIGGLPKPKEFFSCLPEAMMFGRDWRLYLAERHGEPLAALLTFEGGRTVEYVMPVVKESARSLQPTAAILWHAMNDAAARGYTRWNWGGTWLTQEGVYRFKKKWGAKERRYQYFITLNDSSLRLMKAADLSAAYPFFYTLPYSSLLTAEVQ